MTRNNYIRQLSLNHSSSVYSEVYNVCRDNRNKVVVRLCEKNTSLEIEARAIAPHNLETSMQ